MSRRIRGRGPLPIAVALLLAAMGTAPAAAQDVPSDAATPWNLPLPQTQAGITIGGHWPNGQTYAVQALGGLAFAGCGASLVALDLADPAQPAPLGRLELPGTVTRLLVAETPEPQGPRRTVYAYALSFGIAVVDASDPAAMRALALVPTTGRAYELRREGPLLYCALSTEGLLVLDVADPARIREVGRWQTEGSLFDLDLRDGLAYLAYGTAGLVTLDVSDPAAPVEVDRDLSSLAPGICRAACLAGGQLLTCEFAHVLSWDLADPRAPVLVAALELVDGLQEMAVDGSRLFVGGSGLYELDATDPLAPYLLWASPDNAAARHLQPRDGRLALVRYGGPDLSLEAEFFDVAQPGSPLLLGAFDDGGLLEDVARRGDWLFAVGHSDGLRVLDAANPAAIATRARLPIDTAYTAELSGDVLWIGHLRGLTGVDVAEPTRPVVVGQLATWRVENLALMGDTLVAVGPVAGVRNFRLLDVARPEAPALIGDLALPGMAVDVALRGHHALVTGLPYPPNGTGHVQVADIADAARPVLVLSLPLPAPGRALALVDTLLYVACADEAVRVFDVAAPARARLASTVEAGQDLRGIASGSGRLYLLTTEGVTALSLADPLQPPPVGECRLRSMVRRLEVDGRLLAAPTYEAGVWLLRDGSGEGPAPGGFALAVRPTPFAARTQLAFTAPLAGRYEVTIHDLRGRLVRRLFAGELEPGEQAFAWDGWDKRGRPCASGGYVCRVAGPTGQAAARAVLVR